MDQLAGPHLDHAVEASSPHRGSRRSRTRGGAYDREMPRSVDAKRRASAGGLQRSRVVPVSRRAGWPEASSWCPPVRCRDAEIGDSSSGALDSRLGAGREHLDRSGRGRGQATAATSRPPIRPRRARAGSCSHESYVVAASQRRVGATRDRTDRSPWSRARASLRATRWDRCLRSHPRSPPTPRARRAVG